MTYFSTSDLNFTEGRYAKAISVYADAARADASLVLSTGVTASDARVSDAGEGFTGVIRWLSYADGTSAAKPTVDDTGFNSLASANYMTAGNYQEVYIKNVGVAAARENSIQSLISRVDGLSFLGRQFGAVRARREDASFRSVIQGIGDAIYGTTANLTADADAGVINTFGYRTEYTHSSTSFTPLFENENTSFNRSSFFDVLLDAMTAVSGEFEEPFYYLIVNPDTFNILRKQNVLDVNPVQDGNLNINTLLGGKIRLIVTGNSIGAGTIQTANVSYLLKAGAVHYSNVAVNNPTAIDTNVVTNGGFGDVSIVSRWGNIIHPRGYSWNAAAGAFPADTLLATAGSWSTVATNVNQTGIFPIFHG